MRFGFLMYPGFEELDLIGPWEMATMWSTYAEGPECVTLAQAHVPIRCAKGLEVVPQHSFDDCGHLDYLLIPGGFSAVEQMRNAELLAFVRQVADGAQHMLSVCTGALILDAAGLLDNRRATTHWKFLDELRTRPHVTVKEERWVEDGRIWTSAGVSAGIDLMLAFIARVAGNEAAGIVQFNAEYYPDARLYGEAHRDPRAPGYLAAMSDARAEDIG